MTREVKFSLVISESIKNSVKEPWPFLSLGNYKLKGMKDISEVYSIDDGIVNK